MKSDHSTQPQEPEGVDIELDNLVEPILLLEPTAHPPRGRSFAVFTLTTGQALEVHIPWAIDCIVKDISFATECSYILRDDDGSVEDSGDLLLSRSHH
ncbi:MAG: hypothetical protein JNL82_40890 [Myxococcales bacterium]|nr:hypothetical protein [Myxococcales bacterium]